MSKFDTNGGYFAPKDYLRVNEGGSHEENANGGVQIGVDPEGAPNLLEEGEPVYKDYVYSDNIVAEEEFLKQNNLPLKYAGKLYSKIADDYVSEAEERPLDPISREGLEAMLGRLADAQEQQKQRDQQKELEEELASLSPEELDQLEAMLAQEQSVGTDNPMYGEGPVGAQGEPGIPPEQMMGQAEPVQQPIGAMPMMANGGFLRTFETGGPKKSMADEIVAEILAQANSEPRASGMGNTDLPLVSEHPELDIALMAAQPGGVMAKALAPSAYRGIVSGLANGEDAIQLFAPLAKIGKGAKAALSATEIANINGKIADYGKDIALAEKELAALKKELDVVKKGGPGSKDVIKSGIEKANERIRFAKREQGRLRGQLPKDESVIETVVSESPVVENTGSSAKRVLGSIVDPVGHIFLKGWQPAGKAGKIAKGVVSGTGDLMLLDAGIEGGRALYDEYSAPNGSSSTGLSEYKGYYSEPTNAMGGKINRFDDGGWSAFLKRLADYGYSKNPSNVAGKYAIDRRYDVWGGKTARDIEADKAYQDFTNYVIANSNNADVRNYLRALDAGVAEGTPLLFDGDNLVNGWEDLFRHRRIDGNLGIYHLNPEDIGFLTAPAAPAAIAQNPQIEELDELSPRMAYAMSVGNQAAPVDYVEELSPRMAYAMGLTIPGSSSSLSPSTPVSSKKVDAQSVGNPAYSPLPTWPRYAGAIGSGLLGLYNAFQQPDKYMQRRLEPVLPESRINLQNQVYNPIDQNMVANAIAAQASATNRALHNSGLGPSSAAAILAADNNATTNLGTGFIQTWDANNQRRNAVIAANNQAEAQRANHDWAVDQQRKAIINDAAYKNAYNDLMLQRLNYAAEGDKYTAISNQISNGLQALSGIGKENFAMNQINTNPSFLGYRVAPNGQMIYNPWIAACGGFLKKLKK